MKTLRVLFIALLLLCLALAFVSCGDEAAPAETTGTAASIEAKIVSFEGFTLNGTTLSVTVPNAVDSLPFSGRIAVSDGATWQVTTDREGRNVVPSKSVSLAEGDNTFYVLVTAEDGKTVGSYTVHIRRTPLYTVTFETSGGTAIAPVKVEEGGSVTAPATDPTRAGYAFAGWDNDFTAPVTGNLTVTANWTPNTDTAYAVEYYLQNAAGTGYDKNSTEPKTGTTGASVTAQQKAFDHFTYSAAKSTPTGTVSADGTLVLKMYYLRDTYTVTFSGNGGTLKSGTAIQTVRYGNAATIPSFTRNGYTFTGWDSTAGCDAVAENMTITANWTPNTDTAYAVEYYLQNAAGTGYDKNSTEPKTGTTGASVTAQQKAFDHFTYTATGSNPTGVIAGDGSLILKLYYTRDVYTVNFVGNGGTLKAGSANQRVRYGTAATLPTYVRNGYEFTGWENAEGYDAVVENMTITAQWRILTYTVTYELDGGTNDPANPATYQITDDVALAAPTRGEENFVGWYLPNGQKVDNLKGLYGNLTLTARWGADPDKWEKIGGELSSLDAKYRNLKIEMSTYGDAEKQSKNDLYLAGPDTVDNATRDILKLVYRRNAEANAALGTTVEYVYWSNYGWGSQANQIKQIVYAASSDAPNLFVNMIYDLGNATLLGCFKDVFGLNNSYFDFSCEGWMSEWMNGLSLTGDRAYILGGDYFLDIYRSMAVLPFNAAMMNDYGATLAPALFGSALGAGETMTGRFYDYVEAGNWTWDALAKLSAAIWQDTDGSGQTSINDRLGIIADANSGFCAAVVLYSADVTLTENYSNNGQSWIRYPASSAALGGIFDAVSGVFGGNGALVTNGNTNSATIENPGLAYHNVKFSEDMLLFAGPRMLCAMEDDVFRLMGNAVSVVPMPKISAEKEYRTLIHNVADAGAINVNTNSNKATVLSAYLQFSAEASSGIKNEYLDRYVKYSTFSYTNGTSRMLDLIYAGIASGRDKSIDDLMNTDSSIKSKRWHAIIKDHAFRWTADDLASVYQSAVTEKQSRLDDVLETWYTLPKGTGGSSGHTNHVWATDYTVDRAATCTVAGAKSIHCTSCNAIKPGSEVSIPVIAHTPSADYTVDTPASCTTAGSKSKHCTVCNQSIPGTEVTIPGAHTPAQNYTVELPATCMYGGTKVLYCTTCHEVLDTQDIPSDPDAHVVDDWTVTKQPTLVEKGSRNGVCLLCSTHVYETLVSEPTVLTCTSSTGSNYKTNNVNYSDILGEKHFYPTNADPEGNDLLIEYSILWNETMLHLNGSKDPYITTRIGTDPVVYWSPTFNISYSDCPYAGGFEWTGNFMTPITDGDATTPIGMCSGGDQFADYPNVGGADPDNVEWGWHRVQIRVHQALIDEATLRAKPDGTTADVKDYVTTVTVYIDGVAAFKISTGTNGLQKIADNLFIAQADGTGDINYADGTAYAVAFSINKMNSLDGTTAYIALADVNVTAGKDFVQRVEKVASPAAATLTVDDGVELAAPIYYRLAD